MVNYSGNSSTDGGEEILCARGNARFLLNPLSAGAFLSTHDLLYRRRDSHHLCVFLGEDWVRWNGREVLFFVACG